ncbi:MAG TPA: hypothetical protein EYP64_04855 [Desulfarculaceae bacterium]|nr:hypothetical protein [Desulfarculaceae bacterium]
MKKYLFLIFFIFLISPASAVEVGISYTALYSLHSVFDDNFSAQESHHMVCWVSLTSEECTTTNANIEFEEDVFSLTHLYVFDSYFDSGHLYFSHEFIFPEPGPEWENKDYKFSAVCKNPTGSVTVSTHLTPAYGTYQKLETPSTVEVTLTPTLTTQWSRVPGADYYQIRIYSLNGDGSPDTTSILFNSGQISTNFYTKLKCINNYKISAYASNLNDIEFGSLLLL